MFRLFIFIGMFTFPAFGQQDTLPHAAPPYDSLRIVLEEMYEQDQGIRKKFVEAMQTGAENTGQLARQMNKIDSLNQIQVEEILSNYGWLGKSQVGNKAANAIFYIVQHANLNLMEKHYDEFKALADKGEASPTNAAMMLDRILMYQGRKQVFGTQASSLVRESGEMVIWPIEYPENVNARRKETGFKLSIEESAASMNAIFDPHEKLPEGNVWE